MTKERAAELIKDNLTAIYGYAFDKLYEKDKTEDLSHEIVLEILSSAENLKNDSAFWGFAWRIAENTFRKFIRREQIIKQSLSLESEDIGAVIFDIADESEENDTDERIYQLRCELSLLGKLHREICVAYYVENKSCSSIATELHISEGMVKQHLFKARKRLKEGFEMERKLGEKSYNPGTLKLGFWGDWNYYGAVMIM